MKVFWIAIALVTSCQALTSAQTAERLARSAETQADDAERLARAAELRAARCECPR